MDLTRQQVLAYRVHAHQLDRTGDHPVTDADVLDLGIQDTGTDGALWSLANRGVRVPDEGWPEELVLVWTLRGAPHAYRRTDLPAVARATSPLSEADAAKRVFDAAKPLRAAGLPVLEALETVAATMRDIVVEPTAKGEMSAALTARLDEPHLRFCRPCDAVHVHELPFRLAALQAGLELTPGTSPPVLRRIGGWQGPADRAPARLDPLRAFLHLNGPAAPQVVAAYLDAPVTDVRAHWPDDAAEVAVAGERRWALADDLPALRAASQLDGPVRLLAPFDPLLQTKDRELLVPVEAHRKRLWVALGRPGAVLSGHEVVGTWRPRASGRRLRLEVDRWADLPERPFIEQAELLAASRGLTFAGSSGGAGPAASAAPGTRAPRAPRRPAGPASPGAAPTPAR
ncbi:MAG TPA: crosslink repair DNA glycosylase YcaQ family protein [Nocardioidaceae bacterium]|nr:crosslink repair DNA glycosylase YcaQ family protein [Nocardioidaceae bacterium]